MKSIIKVNRVIIILGLANVLLHLAFYNNLEYHRDELLYFSLGLHPDFGYASVPPLIGWLATLMQAIFGYSLFAVKLFPALMSGFFVVLSAKISKEAGGKNYAQILTGIAVIFTPFSLRTFHLFQPVHLDLFFWTLIFYIILRYINTQKDKYLILIGVIFGLAMLNKYLVALLLPALLLPVLVTANRDIFRKKSFFIGLALGFLIFLPNLIWQINKGLPVINHMHELNETQLMHVSRMDFFKDQMLMTLAPFIMLLLGIVFLLKEKKYRFLFFSVLIVVSVLMILRGKSYYTIGLIPFLIATGSVMIEKYVRNHIARIIIPAFLVLTIIPVLPAGIPVYKQEGLVNYFKYIEEKYGTDAGRRFEDGSIHSLPQDYADQLGWEELAKITAEAYNQIPDKSRALIFCENYGQAGAIAVIGKKYNLPEPISFNESFLYWVPKEISDIQYLIYINNELGEDIHELFSDIKKVGSITNIDAREYGTAVYLCEMPRTDFKDFWHSVLMREGITDH